MGATPIRALGIIPPLLAVLAAAPGARAHDGGAARQVFFDDFSYGPVEPLLAFRRHGWKIRTERGWPGAAGASWATANVSFAADPANPGNRLLRMTASTDGTAAGTSQAQVCQRRKFREGTWATRIRFGDVPAGGPDGDQIVEAFYGISPLRTPLDPDFSELDWEYLPNGGWGVSGSTLWTTTGRPASLDPWIADNVTRSTVGSLAGWHTLATRVGDGSVTYYLDGMRRVTHDGKYYPEVPMSLNYTAWFLPPGTRRRYVQDVDWAFYEAGAALTPRQVIDQARTLRKAGVRFRDAVPAPQPPLDSPCNL